jgi:hypothetical protein
MPPKAVSLSLLQQGMRIWQKMTVDEKKALVKYVAADTRVELFTKGEVLANFNYWYELAAAEAEKARAVPKIITLPGRSH